MNAANTSEGKLDLYTIVVRPVVGEPAEALIQSSKCSSLAKAIYRVGSAPALAIKLGKQIRRGAKRDCIEQHLQDSVAVVRRSGAQNLILMSERIVGCVIIEVQCKEVFTAQQQKCSPEVRFFGGGVKCGEDFEKAVRHVVESESFKSAWCSCTLAKQVLGWNLNGRRKKSRGPVPCEVIDILVQGSAQCHMEFAKIMYPMELSTSEPYVRVHVHTGFC